MKHAKAVQAALILSLSLGGMGQALAEPNDVAVAEASAEGNRLNPSAHSADDLVAIAKARQKNEALNDALNNEALNDSILNNDAITQREDSQNPAVNTAPTKPPVTSSAQSVDADKLILNEPVVDQANILTSSEKQRLANQLHGIYQRGLAQAAVVIVPTTNGLPIFDYALQVADKWQLGNKDIDDGLLIVAAVNDRKLYILTGYGLEGTLPDAAVNRIIREDITPLFKQNDYAAGLSAGISALQARLEADPDVLARADAQAAERARGQSNDAPSSIFLFIMAMIFGNVVTAIFGRFLGSLLTSGGFFVGSLALGGGFFMTLIMTIFIWMFLISRGGGRGGRGGRGGGGGGVIFMPGLGGGGGGFGGGGFGGGGFGGGGGGFGGGGAGGSW